MVLIAKTCYFCCSGMTWNQHQHHYISVKYSIMQYLNLSELGHKWKAHSNLSFFELSGGSINKKWFISTINPICTARNWVPIVRIVNFSQSHFIANEDSCVYSNDFCISHWITSASHYTQANSQHKNIQSSFQIKSPNCFDKMHFFISDLRKKFKAKADIFVHNEFITNENFTLGKFSVPQFLKATTLWLPAPLTPYFSTFLLG